MFQSISRKYIDFLIHQESKKHIRKKHYSNLKDVSSALILLSADNLEEKMLEKIKKMIGENKKITIWLYRNSKETTVIIFDQKTCIFNSKEISFLQKPNERVEKEFKAGKYDLLIDLTTKEILPLKYLLGISDVPCRCGMKKEGYALYDFEIEAPENIMEMELLQQILFYLNTIQTKL